MTSRWGLAMLGLLMGCSPIDPIHQSQRSALGPESPAIPIGPRHRPGQPCAVCHGEGDDAPPFSVAGTVYRDDLSTLPLADVAIELVDAQKRTFVAHTNCAGNFFVTPSEFTPVAPFWISLRFGDNVAVMESPIHREPSCAACHGDPISRQSAGHVFLTADDLVANKITPRPCRPDE